MRRTLTVLAVLLVMPASADAATRYVAVNGTGTACTQTVPCGTFTAGYQAATANDTILVAPGTYPAQSVPAGTKAVTFQGGPDITLRRLAVDASNIALDGINVDANRQKIEGLWLDGPNSTLRNSYVRNNTDNTLATVAADCVSCTIDNVKFTDAVMTTSGENAGIHMECLYSQAAELTIRNSYFENCAVMDVFFTRGTWWGQPEYGGWTLTNNTFKTPRRTNSTGTHFYAVYWAWQSKYDRATVRNNTYEAGVVATDNNGASARFTNSAESCNTPPFGLAGMVKEACGPAPTPTPTPSPTPAPTATPEPTPTETPTPEPTVEPTPEPTASPTPEPTVEPTPSPEPTATPYTPDCMPTCDQDITALHARIDALLAALDQIGQILHDNQP